MVVGSSVEGAALMVLESLCSMVGRWEAAVVVVVVAAAVMGNPSLHLLRWPLD